MRKKLLFGIVLVVALSILLWISNTSYIHISVSGSQSASSITYRLTNQQTHKTTTITTEDTVIKKRLPKGSYEVTVQQADGNFFGIQKTRGFFGTSELQADLKKEGTRSFVGNNPQSCMQYINNVLISYACGSEFFNLQTHVPATADTPTYTLPNTQTDVSGIVEGFVKNGSSTFVLLKTDSGHILYHINSDLSVDSPIVLKSLDNSTSYAIKQYLDGFIVFDPSLNKVLYYSNPTSTPENIATGQPDDNSLPPVTVSVHNADAIKLYSTPFDVKNPKTEAVIESGGSSSVFHFKDRYFDGQLCGTGKLCLEKTNALDIYDISSKSPRLLSTINDVTSINASTSGLEITTSFGVLNFDADSLSGYFPYTFGDYSFNGIQPDGSNYILSLLDNKSRRVAIYVEPSIPNSDSIDKKIEALQKTPKVSFVSIYGKYIYVSADLGQLVYNNKIGGYDYNPQIKSSVSASINSQISNLGIDRSKYSVSSNAF